MMEKFKIEIQKGIEAEMYNQIIREKSSELHKLDEDGKPRGAELMKN
jgi:hypothetical protein